MRSKILNKRIKEFPLMHKVPLRKWKQKDKGCYKAWNKAKSLEFILVVLEDNKKELRIDIRQRANKNPSQVWCSESLDNNEWIKI